MIYLGLAVGASGCGGLLLVHEDACQGVVCDTGFVCVAGTCEPEGGSQLCGPLDPDGSCEPGEICVKGICFVSGSEPGACAPGLNGWCTGLRACIAGECVEITTPDVCSAANTSGLCPGGEICIDGWCYRDPPPCSATEPAGWCPAGESCLSGVCQSVGTTCSASVPNGSCPAWQTCVDGACVGPTAPDACSPSVPTGRCPDDEVCVAGTCTPFGHGNACSAGNPTGLCAAGAACVEGRCVAITADNGCSTTTPAGLCPGGAVCQGGACVHHPCGDGGWQCDPGTYCTGTSCESPACDPVHPDGVCPIDTPVCEQGVCLPPACSPSEPDGRCPFGLVCRAGACDIPDCGPGVPNGWCPTGEVCENEQCVEGPCAPDNLDGICTGQGQTFHPVDGRVLVDQVCCDAQLEGTAGCQLGTCTTPPCSLAEPRGFCPDLTLFCDDGTCTLAPCGPFFQSGTCPVGEECVYGSCLVGGCADEADPDAFCAPDICDRQANVCVTPPCSATYPNGFCPIGEACLGGSCGVPPCSTQYPGGSCPSGQLCVGGGCIDPPCSATYPSGVCGPSFVCNAGVCERAPCGPGAPNGACPADERCVAEACVPYVCSATFPTGPCQVGMVCENEVCVTPACDAQHPGGACGSGEICSGGTCVPQPCSSTYPSGACGAGFVCVAGVCTPSPCGPGVPNGTCPSGERCVSEQCEVYVCSSVFPSGPCPPGEICNAGVCEVPLCSPTYPGGECDLVAVPPQVCAGGACVELPCSPAVTNGTCPANQVCCDASLDGTRPGGCLVGSCVLEGCPTYADFGWCPTGQVCVANTCEVYTCGAVFPTGPCPTPGEVCNAGTCEVPQCSAQYPGGECDAAAVPPEVCSGGVCTPLPCSPSTPNGACPPSQVCCDATLVGSRGCTLGTCVLGDCSPTNTAGRCPSGEVCCDATLVSSGFCTNPEVGTCLPTTCSVQFPFGACPGSQICAAGACVDPCDDTHRLGWCPSSFACVEGRCSLECTDDADCDGIRDQHEQLAASVDTDGDGSPDAYDRDSDGDTVPDAVEAGDLDPVTPPDDFDGDGTADFRELDSDKDHISDSFEAGPAPGVPVDTDTDGAPDMLDLDSDGDGILDACEVSDNGGLCGQTGIVDTALDSDGDGAEDFRDLDSDDDGVSDHIEARATPADDATFDANGVDHDTDGTPDYRDSDSDADGVADADEDVNGDGIVNCQVDGTGSPVLDPRPTPACGGAYDYNPGCNACGQPCKCLLAESSRVHADSDGDSIPDDQDGVFLVCSTANLKPINVFYSQAADYALALEQSFSLAQGLTRGGTEAGMTFDDPVNANGSWAVSGFILERIPSAASMATTDPDPARELIEKALSQELGDRALMAGAPSAPTISLVINRNFTSFDGYGVVVSRYNVAVGTAISTAELRDELAEALDASVTGYAGAAGGPTSTDFTLVTETLYRYDDGATGRVLVAGALTQTGADADDPQSYNYRTFCSAQPNAGTCGARTGCTWTTACEEDPAYQIPLFFADNVTNGSAVAQYGDDLAALCQSLIQQNSILDFLWVIDNSGSMAQEIAQVQTSAELFFGIMNNTEADYRVGQVTTATSENEFEPEDEFANQPNRSNGVLTGNFTGAIAGVVDAASPDRSVTYSCAAGCDNGASSCCSACGSGSVDDPSCYFASRLPSSSGSGSEFGLLMGSWAAFRHNAHPTCEEAADDVTCNALPGCAWMGTFCTANNCALPDCTGPTTQVGCQAIAGCYWNGTACQLGRSNNPADECNGNDPNGTPPGGDWAENELEPPTCEWNPLAGGGAGACQPAIASPCGIRTTQADCDGQGVRCTWDASSSLCVPSAVFSSVLCSADTQAACVTQGGGWCEWDDCTAATDAAQCAARWGCAWSGATCEPSSGAGFCRPPLQRSFRSNASKVAVVLSDEETCFIKDHDFDGGCEWGGYGNLITPYDESIRLMRTRSFLEFYESRGFMVFGIVGDKADPSLPPSAANGGCNLGGNQAEAGQAYVNVAEGTGGGWGSICATDLYPTIESIIIGSLGRASPYRLEGFISGSAVQPIASTIKVAVEVCDVPAEYPACNSGTHMQVVPRSRDSGWDYDGINNTLILYGGARPVLNGDIVASYRYWIDRPQPPEGNPSCPCPETSSPGCACPPGQACGQVGAVDSCAPQGTQFACEGTPGCAWNTSNGGFCVVNGLCEPDPTCGGACGAGTICDPVLGLCVCDVTCGGACGAGQTCDNNNNVNACQGLDEVSCSAPCLWDAARTACYSPTCGQCLCDTTCGGGCPVGQLCDSIPGPTCGQCLCDTTCGTAICSANSDQTTCENAGCFWDQIGGACVGCDTTLTCDDGSACSGQAQAACTADPSCDWDASGSACTSPTCGFCSPPQCGSCPPGTVCDPGTGLCVCDTTCGGGCPDGRTCNATAGPTCGLCLCDTTCGGGCQTGQLCDDNTACAGLDTSPSGACETTTGCFVDPGTGSCTSDTCGLCGVDPSCGACRATRTARPRRIQRSVTAAPTAAGHSGSAVAPARRSPAAPATAAPACAWRTTPAVAPAGQVSRVIRSPASASARVTARAAAVRSARPAARTQRTRRAPTVSATPPAAARVWLVSSATMAAAAPVSIPPRGAPARTPQAASSTRSAPAPRSLAACASSTRHVAVPATRTVPPRPTRRPVTAVQTVVGQSGSTAGQAAAHRSPAACATRPSDCASPTRTAVAPAARPRPATLRRASASATSIAALPVPRG
jgi:hypothetical protein